MTQSLVSWKEEPTKDETWGDLLKPVDEEEAYAFHRAAIEQEKQAAESDLYTVSETELLARWQKEAQKLEAAELPAKQIDAVHQFLVECPEFVTCPKNQQRIDQYFTVAKLDGSSPDHFIQAYKALASRGLVVVDELKRPRQPRKQITEQDLYEMPLEALEEMARGQK